MEETYPKLNHLFDNTINKLIELFRTQASLAKRDYQDK